MKKKFLFPILATIIILNSIVGNAQDATWFLNNLHSPTAINKDLLPNNINTLDLGHILKSWRNIYISRYYYLSGNLVLHTTGPNNFFVGNLAGNTLISGQYNTGVGRSALHYLTSGFQNTANGYRSMFLTTSGWDNTASGYSSMANNTTGYRNTAMGSYALRSNIKGAHNTAMGYNSLYSNQDAGFNSAFGAYALYLNKGSGNAAMGYASLRSNTIGYNNTANGYDALFANTTGHDNTANGYNALYANTTGSSNTAFGARTMSLNSTGSGNTALGFNAKTAETVNNSTVIGINAYADHNNTIILGGTGDYACKVGIGTSNPAYKLSVNGTIQAKEIRVETGWADYVFEKTYQLRSLEKVSKYIDKNKHLPGIPSAKEISGKGLAVGQVQTKMMEKIEELTLYLIDVNTRIKTVEKQNSILRKQIRNQNK